jgi:hypothetical protein
MDIEAIISNLKAARRSLKKNFRSDLKRLDHAVKMIRKLEGGATSSKALSPAPKRKLSRKARLAISKAQKARWAKQRK